MKPTIAIIGAGISGLTLANQLKSVATITVFEKARGVGGRMSTRYNDQFEFDHGAQYFTARSSEFRKFLQPFIEKGIVAEWMPRLLTLSKMQKPYKRDWFEPHYTATPRMNSLCKALAGDITLNIGTEIATIEEHHGSWKLTSIRNEMFEGFDWVISSAPVPQTQKLMPRSFIAYDKLAKANMIGCMSVMLGLKEAITLPFDAAIVKDSAIEWIAVNNSKPNRKNTASLMVQTSSEWAEEHMEEDLEILKEQLIKEVVALTPLKEEQIFHSAIHRWRYADVASSLEENYLIDTQNKLATCGDWCLGGRVENAFLSAYHLANHIKQEL